MDKRYSYDITRNLPNPGEVWMHFKGSLYMIHGVFEHTETKGKFIGYQALYGDYRKFIRPIDMFMSEVDTDKYPDAPQKYRFEFYRDN